MLFKITNSLFLKSIVTKPCGGKFGAPSPSPEPNTLKINAESHKVPPPLSANQKNSPALPGIFLFLFISRFLFKSLGKFSE
jgi:hypothetical protein